MRAARREARFLAGQMRPQMDAFLNAVGESVEFPLDVIYADKVDADAELEADAQWLQTGGAYMQGEDLGRHVIISGGEVMEL